MTVSKRDAAKKTLVGIVSWLNKVKDNTSLGEAELASDRLEKAIGEFRRLHDDVLAITGATEADFQHIEGDSVEKIYSDARVLMDKLLIRLVASTNTATGVISKQTAMNTSGGSAELQAATESTGTGETSGGSAVLQAATYSTGTGETSGGSACKQTSIGTAELAAAAGAGHNNNDIVSRNAGVALLHASRSALRLSIADTPMVLATTHESMLATYWTTYMTAVFADWNAEPGAAFQRIEDEYMRAKAHLTTIIDARTQPPAARANNIVDAPIRNNNELKLPPIEIPKFSGCFQSWSSFFDLFTSMVHNAAHLSDVQRMHYLRTCVEGEAENLIRAYKVTDANYLVAWNALQARYNNRRLIVNAHLDDLFKIPVATTDSASSLRRLLDSFSEAVRALGALELPIQEWDAILVHVFVAKLDAETKRTWEMSLVSDDIPSFAQLGGFLERRCRSLDAAGQPSSTSKPQQRHTSGGDVRQAASSNATKPAVCTAKTRAFVTTNTKSAACVLCKADHGIMACPEFSGMYPGVRYRKARELNLCFNCLRADHRTASCGSNNSCRKCGNRHHTMLHYDDEKPVVANSALTRSFYCKYVLLATAVARIEGANGVQYPVRILLDSGSQSSFVTESCAQRGALVRTRASIPVAGLGRGVASHTRGQVGITIQPAHAGHAAFFVQAFVLTHITQALPSSVVNKAHIPFLARIPILADPTFDVPGEIDVLLGADVLGALMLDDKLHSRDDKALFAQNTKLGWVIAGPIPSSTACNLRTMVSLTTQLQLDLAVERFWEMEEFGPVNTQSSEEMACELHFATTHRRDSDGRYTVELPFREQAPALGDSRASALRSLQSLERRFRKQPGLQQQYTQFLDEYIELGHMSLVTQRVDERSSFYLPHHPVFKASSTSTKLRVVFDASRKTSTGVSLNEILMVGPKLQQNLFDILLRFRAHAVAFCGDIVKMYRQIRTTPASSEFQRILWRPSPQHEVRTYRLNTVTYGTASASYLATKALQQLAHDEAHRFPLASQVALQDFYVDDIMTGCDNIDDAITLQHQLIDLAKAGGFALSKWASNVDAILEGVPESQREINCPLEIHTEKAIKTLGLSWNPSADCFQYRVNLPDSCATTTKRVVLSEVASLFDPLGLLAPLIIAAKIYMQVLWAERLGWDEPLSHALVQRFADYRSDLNAIHALNIPRWLGIHRSHTHQLHGFCDASEAAYAAVVYLRSVDSTGNIVVRIITARTKVAPVKKVCLPRLELCGAVLLAKLLVHVKTALLETDIETHAWCDSTVALAWIRKPSHLWQTFVANRVSAIQSRSPPEIWSHVPGTQNPADAASRGQSASALVKNDLWWNGPPWLMCDAEFWPCPRAEYNTTIDAKPTVINLHVDTDSLSLASQFSSFMRLQRVSALMMRFHFNCQRVKAERRTGPLTTIELRDAAHRWVRATQALAYPDEISACKAGQIVANNSPLKSLAPMLDENGVLRVGGRLGNAHISFDARHPAILPKNSHLADLLVAQAHHASMHGGPQLTIAVLRQRYWVISARTSAKQFIRSCPVCIRHRKAPGQQMMAPLPTRRTQPTRAFLTTGVDYAGPITIKLQPGRGTKTSKAYIALFVCFSTKALHLELVSSLTTDAFVAAFRRFVARRGKCAHLYSDCGTNFVGACKELRTLHGEVVRQLKDTTLADRLASDSTQWHFNPPGAPNFGGIWEAGVKSVKHHLRRVLGTSLYTFEELNTTLAQIEAILNSRPICPMSDDADDPQALTPGHFLIGEPMTTVPDPALTAPIPPLRRWQHLQQTTQHFWNRWRREYITTLQQRFKWTKKREDVQLGSLALIIDETLPPAKWSLGRVVELHPGSDGSTRVVTLKHKSGFVKRPITKLCLFPNLANPTYVS